MNEINPFDKRLLGRFYKFIRSFIISYFLLIFFILLVILMLRIAKYPISNEDLFNIISKKNVHTSLDKKCIKINQDNPKNLIYNLQKLMADHSLFKKNKVIKNIQFSNFPQSIFKLSLSSQENLVYKNIIIKSILLSIIRDRGQIMQNRAKLISIGKQLPYKRFSKQENDFLHKMNNIYNMQYNMNNFWDKVGLINSLYAKVYYWPNSFVLGVVLLNTNFGQSITANNWPASLVRGSNPSKSSKDIDSVISHFINIMNSSELYHPLRNDRYKLWSRYHTNKYRLRYLVKKFAYVSHKGKIYEAKLWSLIEQNHLMDYDKYTAFIKNNEKICIYF